MTAWTRPLTRAMPGAALADLRGARGLVIAIAQPWPNAAVMNPAWTRLLAAIAT